LLKDLDFNDNQHPCVISRNIFCIPAVIIYDVFRLVFREIIQTNISKMDIGYIDKLSDISDQDLIKHLQEVKKICKLFKRRTF